MTTDHTHSHRPVTAPLADAIRAQLRFLRNDATDADTNDQTRADVRELDALRPAVDAVLELHAPVYVSSTDSTYGPYWACDADGQIVDDNEPCPTVWAVADALGVSAPADGPDLEG